MHLEISKRGQIVTTCAYIIALEVVIINFLGLSNYYVGGKPYESKALWRVKSNPLTGICKDRPLGD